jgi:hypothetical protein
VTLSPDRLHAALRTCAAGIHPHEAGTSLLIDSGSWLHRDDFSRCITTGTSISDGTTLMASTDRDAAIASLNAGQLPSSSGERRMLLLAASIAAGTPVSLYDTIPGIDQRNASLVIKAIIHATGHTHSNTDVSRQTD